MFVITGTSDGLGRELADLYLREGKRVVGLSREVGPEGIEHIPTDLLDDAAIARAVAQIVADEEPLVAVINCAGVLSVEKLEALTPKEVDRVLDTNVRAPMLLTSGLMEKIKKDGADIVNVASTVGLKAYADQAAYGVSKWALRGFSANLQLELKDFPSRVISFCTGGFTSRIFVKATGVDMTEIGSWMSARDVAQCLKQLLELPKNMEVTEILMNRK